MQPPTPPHREVKRRFDGQVLHIIDTIGPGGAETIYLEIADGMRRRGWLSRCAVLGEGWVHDSLNARRLPVDMIRTRGGRFDYTFGLGLRRIVKAGQIKLIHSHLFSTSVYASAIGAITGVPVVATLHGASDVERGSWSRRLRYRLLRSRATTVCVSNSLKEDLLKASQFPDWDVGVIPNGIDTTVFARAGGQAVRAEHDIQRSEILVGALGNLRAPKDFPTFIKAAARIAADQRYKFAIVGERTEPLHSELVKLRDSLGLEARLSFWGFRTDIAEVMAAFDVLAISSSSEGFSLAAVQAMASGTPVIATRCGGPEEIIVDGENGLLVPVRSPEALASGLRRLTDSVELRERLSMAGRITAERKYGVEAMLDAYEGIYESRLSDAR